MPKKRLVGLIALVASFSLFIVTSTASAPDAKIVTSDVGSIKGDFQVTPSGQAHYSMPIEVPPGTAGMTPALSLVYDSSS